MGSTSDKTSVGTSKTGQSMRQTPTKNTESKIHSNSRTGALNVEQLKKWNLSGEFHQRHIGPNEEETAEMLKALNFKSLNELVETTVPKEIQSDRQMDIPQALSEANAVERARDILSQNKVFRSYIGMGYYPTRVPNVILRNILENPGWYTQYTPYQAEISQGRLEALLNFQTVICDLTELPLSNSSLLDEGTAAAEAMGMLFALQGMAYGRNKKPVRTQFFVSDKTHPQTIEVLGTRAKPLGIEIVTGNVDTFEPTESFFGALFQNPDTTGTTRDFTALIEKCHATDMKVAMACDLMSLTLTKSPGSMGADVALGTTQRFGVPMGFGGPHAGYFATREEFKRNIPGRIVGVSKDADGNKAYRLALQTREQHIKRERATSNICTAQVLLAIMASMYSVYHGPKGLRKIANRIRSYASAFRSALSDNGVNVLSENEFDTIHFETQNAGELKDKLEKSQINIRFYDDNSASVSFHEVVTVEDLQVLLDIIIPGKGEFAEERLGQSKESFQLNELNREQNFLEHKVFNSHRSETQMLRYMQTLQQRDLSLTHSMIALGSCTMKLNSTSEMLPVTWPQTANVHPFAPESQTKGYKELITELEGWLAECTGFDAVSLQPNAGSQGEYAGLLVIRQYHESKGEGHRNICLIPSSAHGTNPASAVMAGMKVVTIKCDENGNVDLADLKSKAEANKENLSALMVTYPSTHGVFEKSIVEICKTIHDNGGQVYLDGANMNAQIGICYPGEYGADVCHLNLHKTFCIPHGGGGPGVGPICVKEHLKDFLPGHSLSQSLAGKKRVSAISAAPYGSPSILPISWMYICMMGPDGLTQASKVAILNANYVAKRLSEKFSVLYKGEKGLVAHECIVDLRDWQNRAGITVEDVAKRLMDYGFHSPTMSWPVAGTLMIEPTESESKDELDRFCDALLSIHSEMEKVEKGEWDKEDNPLKFAPHTAQAIAKDEWTHMYSREIAAYPLPYVRTNKFWPHVSRVDNPYGDKNLFCTCS